MLLLSVDFITQRDVLYKKYSSYCNELEVRTFCHSVFLTRQTLYYI